MDGNWYWRHPIFHLHDYGRKDKEFHRPKPTFLLRCFYPGGPGGTKTLRLVSCWGRLGKESSFNEFRHLESMGMVFLPTKLTIRIGLDIPMDRWHWYTYIHEWLIFMVHVGEYAIHGSYGDSKGSSLSNREAPYFKWNWFLLSLNSSSHGSWKSEMSIPKDLFPLQACVIFHWTMMEGMAYVSLDGANHDESWRAVSKMTVFVMSEKMSLPEVEVKWRFICQHLVRVPLRP